MIRFISDFFDVKHLPERLKKYHEAAGIFTILLKNGDIIHFQPTDKSYFEKWLNKHNIPNLRDDEVWISLCS